MQRFTVAALTSLLLFTLTLSAGETSAKKPLGKWTRTKHDTTVRFHFTNETIHFISDGPFGKLEVEADYGISKDGKVLFGRIRTVKEGGGVGKGDLLSFDFKIKGDTLTISDWKGTGGAGFGIFLQGDYKKTDDK
jgi:hypothetical protein